MLWVWDYTNCQHFSQQCASPLSHDMSSINLLRQNPELHRHHWILIMPLDIRLLDRTLQITPFNSSASRVDTLASLFLAPPRRQQPSSFLSEIKKLLKPYHRIIARIQPDRVSAVNVRILDTQPVAVDKPFVDILLGERVESVIGNASAECSGINRMDLETVRRRAGCGGATVAGLLVHLPVCFLAVA